MEEDEPVGVPRELKAFVRLFYLTTAKQYFRSCT